jgi:hypothetical protein
MAGKPLRPSSSKSQFKKEVNARFGNRRILNRGSWHRSLRPDCSQRAFTISTMPRRPQHALQTITLGGGSAMCLPDFDGGGGYDENGNGALGICCFL